MTTQVLFNSPTSRVPYSLLLTTAPEDVLAAQRLRHAVFANEMGAVLASTVPGADQDEFDPHCEHLIVRHEHTGEVVGTYRMLPPERAREAGRLYADDEFDLTALDRLRPTLVETGRACVHPEHRTGAVVGLMWAGIARYMLLTGHAWLVGCLSVSLADGGGLAAGVADTVQRHYQSPPDLRVRPLQPWVGGVASRGVLVPPLLRGYLRLGAWVCGPPAHDRNFGAADFLVLLSMGQVDQRYLRFLLRSP